MDRSGRWSRHDTGKRWIGSIQLCPLPGNNPGRTSAGPAANASAEELPRRTPAIMKLIYRQIWRLDFVGHGASVSDRTERPNRLGCLHSTPQHPTPPSGLGYPNPAGMFGGDSVQSPQLPTWRRWSSSKATLNLGKTPGLKLNLSPALSNC